MSRLIVKTKKSREESEGETKLHECRHSSILTDCVIDGGSCCVGCLGVITPPFSSAHLSADYYDDYSVLFGAKYFRLLLKH